WWRWRCRERYSSLAMVRSELRCCVLALGDHRAGCVDAIQRLFHMDPARGCFPGLTGVRDDVRLTIYPRARGIRGVRMMAKQPNWTHEQDELLRKHYADTPIDELLVMFPGRGAHGIRKRAQKIGVRKDFKKPFYDPDWLRHHYVNLGLTTTEIGEMAGVHRDTILYWLRKHGIPRRQAGYRLRMRPEEVAKLRRLYHVERRSSRDIAAKLGHSKDTILYRMKKAGIPRRDRIEAAPRGEDHPQWKGGRYVTSEGYVKTMCPGHPRADSQG